MSPGASKRNPSAPQNRCGPLDRIIEWEVRIFRDVCQTQPDCGYEAEPCPAVNLCPGEPWPTDIEMDGCEPLSRAWQQALLFADRAALEQGLAKAIDECICQAVSPDCDSPCGYTCSEKTKWTRTVPSSGGGCAGSVLYLETHTIGT